MENAFGIIVSRFRVLLGTMEKRLKVVRDSVLTCGFAQHAEKTRAEQAGHPPQQMTYSSPTK